MEPRRLPRRRLGKSGLQISVLSLGGVGLGGQAAGDLYGGVSDEEAIAAVHRAIELGINFIDTSPLYRESERRIGLALEALSPEQREGVMVGSKVGDDCPPYSDNGGHSPFSHDGVVASIKHTFELLRVVRRLETVLLHDPTMEELDEFFGPRGGMGALLRLQSEGAVGAVGIGCVEHDVHRAFLRRAPAASVLLSVNDYNLLRRFGPAGSWQDAEASDVGVLNAGAYYMGLLAAPSTSWGMGFKATLQQPELAGLAVEMEQWCLRRGVALKQVALQFATAHRAVASVPVGCRTAAEVDETVDALLAPLPSSLLLDFQAEFDARVDALGREAHWFYDKNQSDIAANR